MTIKLSKYEIIFMFGSGIGALLMFTAGVSYLASWVNLIISQPIRPYVLGVGLMIVIVSVFIGKKC